MIYFMGGRPGNGKSFNLCQRAMKYLASGGCLVTNMELNPDGFAKYLKRKYGWELQDGQVIILEGDEVVEFYKHVPMGTRDKPVMVVLDELHLQFNTRDTRKQKREVMEYLTLHRRYHVDIYFVSQHLENVDIQWRRLCQCHFYVRDMTQVVLPGLGIRYPFRHFLEVTKDWDNKTEIGRRMFFKDPAVFKCYNSFQLFREFPGLKGQKTDFKAAGKVRRRYMSKALIVCVVIGVIGVWRLKEHWGEASAGEFVASPGTAGEVARASVAPATSGCPEVIWVTSMLGYSDGPVRITTSEGSFSTGDEAFGGRIVAIEPHQMVICTGGGEWIHIRLRMGQGPPPGRSKSPKRGLLNLGKTGDSKPVSTRGPLFGAFGG